MSSPPDIILETSDLITAFVGLGANLPSSYGAPLATLKAVINRLKADYARLVCSSFYRTEAVDCAAGTPDFINAVIAIYCDLDHRASDLMGYLQELEEDFGRIKANNGNASRPLDLDILWFGNFRVSSESLTIPHPRAAKRRFVMQPLVEIAPQIILPGQTQTAKDLLNKLPLAPKVNRIS
ncbi:MAG: 2-amino-4-hydroxy-6-hydroxymethyldihydropteridine diphosphokinase [Gammaproteobacteria bacterium]|nr:2-amino-4-hydroxy-6-hydroxymethyldihydropteridine diphosphokinase [Gammaproteobacteria bacterium]|tara:strand:+ start:1984 stop:2526 length:543 start_codon:yes stop_codon:yes gene_type:complete